MCTVFSPESVGDSDMNHTLALLLWSLSFSKEMMRVCDVSTGTCKYEVKGCHIPRGKEWRLSRGRGLDKVAWREKHLI